MHIDGWRTWLSDRVRPDTATHYRASPHPDSKEAHRAIAIHCRDDRRVVGRARPRAEAQGERGRAVSSPSRMRSPRKIIGATKRKYRSAAQSFAAYLIEIGVLASNSGDVNAPRQNKPKAVEIDCATCAASSAPPSRPSRALFALLCWRWNRDLAALTAGSTTTSTCAAERSRTRAKAQLVRAIALIVSRIGRAVSEPSGDADARRATVPRHPPLAGGDVHRESGTSSAPLSLAST